MKRLLVNLLLILFIAWLGYFMVYPMLMCFGGPGLWSMSKMVCVMPVPVDISPMPSQQATTTPAIASTTSAIDLSKVHSLTIAVPDLHTNVTLTQIPGRIGEFTGDFPIVGSKIAGSILVRLSEATLNQKANLALIPFVVESGGSGNFVYAGLFAAQGKELVYQDAHFVGDRISLVRVKFVDDTSALVSYLDRKISDAMTAPPTLPQDLSLPITPDLHFGDAKITTPK